jgi:hypothetical protein
MEKTLSRHRNGNRMLYPQAGEATKGETTEISTNVFVWLTVIAKVGLRSVIVSNRPGKGVHLQVHLLLGCLICGELHQAWL